MALFLGNLSPHVRYDELERVFSRFGRCKVQLKGGYGFVIYGVPVNAERALRAMRGKVICGERVSLTWANKQPRPSQKFTRNGRFSKLQRGKNFIREENTGVRSRSSQDRRDHATGKRKYLSRNHGEKHYEGDDTEEHGVEKFKNLEERVMEQGNALEPNPLENDRWGDPVGDSLINEVDNGTDFDRYEPYHGLDKVDETEKPQISSYDSARGGSPGRHSKDHSGFDNPKSQRNCYVCGLMGHKMRNCPQADVSRQWFGRRRDGGIESRGRSGGRIKKLRHTSWRGEDGRDIMISRRRVNSRKDSGSWKSRRLVNRTGDFLEKRAGHGSQLGRDSQRKKRHREEDGSPNKHHGKRGRTSDSSLLHSDSTASSHPHSSSSKSVSRISPRRSHSRSVSSRSYSVSSSSRSTSASSYSHSHSARSKLRSSSSRSLSLSISLGQQSSSPRKVEMDVAATSQKDDLGHAMVLKRSANVLHEQRSPVGDIGLDGLKRKDVGTVQEGEMNEMQPPEGGGFTLMNSSSQNFRETNDFKRYEPVQMDPTISQFRTLKLESPVNCQPSSSTRISSEEMCMVLKHYGLKTPEESERHLSVDAFFGAARLWPWELIYYRRLKKGPISTTNYARRIEQNKEFGIVDKYIRSSSGWGENNTM